MTSSDDGTEFRNGALFPADAEHDLFAKTMIALEERIDAEMGWGAQPCLFLLSADPDTKRVAAELLPPRRWGAVRPGQDPGASLLAFARSLGGPTGFRARSFADSPDGRCGFAFLAEGFGAPRSGPGWAKPVAKRFVTAADIGGRRYMVARERGELEARYVSVPGAAPENVEEVPTALWLLTAALVSGAFTL